MKNKLLNRFLKYVSFDTQSKTETEQIPSTEKQRELAKYVYEELKSLGMQDVDLDDNCYLYATLPANTDEKLPVMGFISHLDTSPDFSGKDVKPKIWKNYNGRDLELNPNLSLKTKDFPEILAYKGQTIITTDGSTLLGADDKAGMAEIVTAMEYLLAHPEIKHGKIRTGFTPDEEVGRGADLFDVKRFAADFAYTMDGSALGELEYENFNAAFARVTTRGLSVHPGYAKNKMVNSMLIASEFAQALPKNERPETTDGYEGFFHVTGLNGDIETTTVDIIIRDHSREKFENRKEQLEKLTEEFKVKYGKDTIEISIKDQYYNMLEKLKDAMHVVDRAKKAMLATGVEPKIKPIRGGTDGARLSYMGLPCPNIFTGGHNFHGKFEFAVLETMLKASEFIVQIAKD